MLRKIRALFKTTATEPRPTLSGLPNLPPDTSMATWLAQFIVEARRALGITSATGLPLCGSIGFDAELLSDGTVIWHSYDIGGEEPDVWRIATREERISALIMGAERMPQLSVLLPTRDALDADCDGCEATGYVIDGVVLCGECGGIGWTPHA